MRFFLIVALLIAILGIIFAVQNTTPVTVSFLTWDFNSSVAVVSIIALAAGFLIGYLVATPSIVRQNFAIRSHRKKIGELESNLTEQKVKLDEAQKQLEEKKLQEQNQQSQAGQGNQLPEQSSIDQKGNKPS